MLEEEHIDADISAESGSRTESDGPKSDAEDSPVDDRNIADSTDTCSGADREPGDEGAIGKDEAEKEAKGHKKGKSAKKTSRKELIELISNKNDMLVDMEARLKDLEKELKNKEDKILRIAAEFENYKKRTRREWELLEKRAKAELITDILGVLDDFDRAIEALGEREDHVADGVVLIVTSLKDVLYRAGLGEVEALGHPFDPQFHEAVGETEEGEGEGGAVAHVVQKGYKLNDVLIRPAKVIVSKKK